MNCSSCIFGNPEIYEYQEEDDTPVKMDIDMRCWRYPPTMFLHPSDEEGFLIPIYVRPSVSENDWCGEYKTKPIENEDADDNTI